MHWELIGRLFMGMVAAHVLFDYPLQGDFLSKAKNPWRPIPGVPWYQAMGAHCFLHGAAVYAITGFWQLGVAEFILHFMTDICKCADGISFNRDQFIHYTAKLTWAVVAVLYMEGYHRAAFWGIAICPPTYLLNGNAWYKVIVLSRKQKVHSGASHGLAGDC